MSIALELPPFPGVRPQAFKFLRDLKRNNDRDWFAEWKSVYEDELLWPARCLVAQISAEGERRGIPVSGTPTKSVFRIYRDIRFSKNKDPYKTHLGVILTRGGDKKEPGGLYVHVEPGGCFVAAGFWQPDPKALLPSWRDSIASAPDRWTGMVETLDEAGLSMQPGPMGTLKRMPRGYEDYGESPVADFLKWKGAIAEQKVSDEDVAQATFAEKVMDIGREAMPLLEWGWRVQGKTAS